jgi:hypothetical protein
MCRGDILVPTAATKKTPAQDPATCSGPFRAARLGETEDRRAFEATLARRGSGMEEPGRAG